MLGDSTNKFVMLGIIFGYFHGYVFYCVIKFDSRGVVGQKMADSKAAKRRRQSSGREVYYYMYTGDNNEGDGWIDVEEVTNCGAIRKRLVGNECEVHLGGVAINNDEKQNDCW